MTYTEEMTTSEILLRLASMRNELLQAVNDIEKISKNICYKAEQTENSSEKPNNCEVKNYCDDCLYADTCDSKEFFYACTSKPTISKMEQVDEPQLTPNYCGTCKHREVPCGDLPCDACHGYSNYEPKDEPQTDKHKCRRCLYYDISSDYYPCSECVDYSNYSGEVEDEPQTDCAWK